MALTPSCSRIQITGLVLDGCLRMPHCRLGISDSFNDSNNFIPSHEYLIEIYNTKFLSDIDNPKGF